MLIENQKLSLTPSEANWVALKLSSKGQHELACSLVRARREAVAAHLPHGLFDGIAEFPSIPIDHPWWGAFTELTKAEKEHARDKHGNELHTTTVALPPDTLALLHDEAQSMYDVIRTRLMEVRPGLLPQEDFDEDYDPNDPKELYEKAQQEENEAALFDLDLAEMQVLGGIAVAIKAHRSSQEQQE